MSASVEDQGKTHGDGHVTPLFALVFGSAVGITLLSGIAMFAMSWSGKDSENIKSAVATCSDIFKMGVAAVLGLIGGKTASR